MSYLFRDNGAILGPDAKVELPNGASAATLVKMQVVETAGASGLSATSTSQSVFIAPPAASVASGFLPLGSYQLVGVSVVFGTASTSGTLMVEKTPSGTAVGSGTNLLTGTISLAGTANTTLNGTLVSNPNTLTLNAGDRISIVLAGTLTSLANCAVTLFIARV